ncbi:hypothetical protein O181_083644 [Austropuccinia psidii MF-1]|uniref:Uncharacterized protein n=1 Tax=Austropuccinia psidii MF-1 TaxID=1389203 RepID=A0A9Q3FRL0_9BASI|nr:hypothetical protein [Austropuccinia psidii MF-1]
MLSTSISPVKISHFTDFNHIFHCQKMKLCNCQSCQKHILNKANQPIKGKFISECNKCKHEHKDIPHLRNNYSFNFQPPLSPHSGEPSSSTSNIESTDSQTDEVNGILEPQDSLLMIASLFVCWLHLLCSLSLLNCNIAYKFAYAIISVAQIDTILELKPKCDLHTIIKSLNIHPEMNLFVCCHKCYSLYEGHNVPMVCTYKPVGQTQCNTSLFNSITNFSALQDKGIGPRPPSTIQSNELGAINK